MATSQQVTFPVYGMNCAGCASKLTTSLNKIDGVKANVNITLEQATLTFNPRINTTSVAPQIVSTLQLKGYQTDYQQIIFEADWSCAGCVEGTIKALKKHILVIDVKANFSTKTLYVETLFSFINDSFIQALIKLSPSLLTRKQTITSQQHLLQKQALEKKTQRKEKLILLAALILSLPFWLAMLSMLFNQSHFLPAWLEFTLATPLQFIIGARFYKGAWRSIKSYSANMDLYHP